MKTQKKSTATNPAFELATSSFLPAKEYRHVYEVGDGKDTTSVICVTDTKGFSHPDNKSRAEIRVDATHGFIPLWDKEVILNWRFNKSFGSFFKDGDAAKAGVRELFGEVITAWEDAAPVKFHEDDDSWDFEIAMHETNCNDSGCVLASSFFPGSGRNKFYIYPTMFEQSQLEQKETIEHEMGHIFGLRHFFANISETDAKSELFGKDSSFSIMNYGAKSKLTADDVKDLKHLYELVWSTQLTEINGTKIKTFVSYHMNR